MMPARAGTFAAQAEEAMKGRVLAGVEYPGDVAAGREIGRKVAALAIARGKADGSDAKWTGHGPDRPGQVAGQQSDRADGCLVATLGAREP
jgi:hypothetical protein